MANHFPVLPVMQVAALQYAWQITGIGGPLNNSMPAGQLGLINFGFQSGADASGMLLFDYSQFDQDAHEAQMRTLLNGICAAMAANLGRALADVQAAMTVSRSWAFYSPVPVSGSYPGITVTDQMPYP